MKDTKPDIVQDENGRVDVLASRIEALITEARTKVVSYVNTAMVYTYYEIGRMIVEDEQGGEERAAYGKNLLNELSKRLTHRFGKGWSVENLTLMRKFFITYSNSVDIKSEPENRKQCLRNFQLSWSHYLKLMRISDPDERSFYEIEATQNHWSLRELERQFDSSLYERLALSRNKEQILQLSKKGQIIEKPQDLLKDPYILEFTGLPELPDYTENTLEQKIIDNLQAFLLELGKGFTFVGRQVRLSFSEEHYYIDLVFYNRLLKSFVLIDLKRGKLKHQDIGQMQMYVNYYDRDVKLEDENPTIGLLLCADKENLVVEYTLPLNNNQIFAAKYETVLPSKEELKKLISNR
ncbi:MAG: PDDEXK nuclease domain-containing protein [Bacteroidales bacterium]|nr:PDDEXK nuclease domain-containing protein [Bacteroidales bacterium]